MRTLLELAIFFIGTTFGWWMCRHSAQEKIDAMATQLKLNQAKMLEMVNANIRSRKHFR